MCDRFRVVRFIVYMAVYVRIAVFLSGPVCSGDVLPMCSGLKISHNDGNIAYPQNIPVNQTLYREVLERLRERVASVRPGIARTWMLHHDNAPCHTAVSINEFLAEKSIHVVPQPLFAGSQSL